MPIASVLGGVISQGGANAAAGKAGEAAGNAEFIRRRNEANLSPWFQSGQGAQGLITNLLGLGNLVPDGQGYGGLRLDSGDWRGAQQNAMSRFQASPDYQFRFNEGQRALDRSAASRGMLLSGAQNKASQEFGGNLASGEFNNWFSKLMGTSGMGQNAAMGENQSNLQATQLGNNALMAQGGFQKAGADALGSGIGQGMQNLLALGAFGGAGGSFGIPGFGSGGGAYSVTGPPAGGYNFRMGPNGLPVQV